MRLIISFLAIAVMALGVLTACNSAEWRNARTPTATPAGAPAPQVIADGARRVTVTELKDLLANNEAVVIDVRNQTSYDAGHIRGAKLIPEGEVVNRSDELPRNKLIVTYCSWPNEHTSARAVVELKTKGIENAGALLGGFAAWQSAGLPIDTKDTKAANP